MADESKFDSEFKLLVKSIYGETIYRKPELGKTPAWVTEEITFEPKISLQFASFKTQINIDVNNQNFTLFLDNIKSKILEHKMDNIDRSSNEVFYKQYLDKYNGLTPIRNEYLELIKNSIYVDNPEKRIASFFEKTYLGITQCQTSNKELLSIWLHEIFIYTIAYFLKLEKYDKVAYILGKTYCAKDYSGRLSSYSIFYTTNHDYFDEAVRVRDNKRYYTGVGYYWIENLKTDFCTKAEFTLGDILCFNYYLYGNHSDLDVYWFPITYVYGTARLYGTNVLSEFAQKLKTKEFLDTAFKLFNYTSYNDFVVSYKMIEEQFHDGKLREYRYKEAFEYAPILCHYTKLEELGKYR